MLEKWNVVVFLKKKIKEWNFNLEIKWSEKGWNKR
jgi:hypothetical protein